MFRPSSGPGAVTMEAESDGGAVAGRAEWAGRMAQQAEQCGHLGSALYDRLLRLLADDVRAGGPTWDVVATHAGLRFGQAGPLRLVGGAHRLALAGAAPGWAAVLPSCGGTAPDNGPAGDAVLAAAWADLCATHHDDLVAAMDREVQTNEVARVGGLGLAVAVTGFSSAHLVEMGCSGALNLRMDRFCTALGPNVVGDPSSAVQVRPELRGAVPAGLRLPDVLSRTGIDPFPVDATTEDGRLTLLSFVWPDQIERFDRIAAAIDVARAEPVELVTTTRTAEAVAAALQVDGPRVVLHSIVWQYLPTPERWAVTEALESAGERATADSPLAWVRFEPDEWDRRRAAVWLRTWSGAGSSDGAAGQDRLVAQVDYHGRWVRPLL